MNIKKHLDHRKKEPDEYSTSPTDQAILDTHNVEEEESSDLLAQPQHTNYDAYPILQNAVYPFTLPYHQPIDSIRIFLDYLKTSRYELMNAFGSKSLDDEGKETEFELLHIQNPLERALDAEYLGLTEEEYTIITKEAFLQKQPFDVSTPPKTTKNGYPEIIIPKPIHNVWEYFGYRTEGGMFGLTFVKEQFLKRTGLKYSELVELLKTDYVNPNRPHGQNREILENIKLSYPYLQTQVDTSSADPQTRYSTIKEKIVDAYKEEENDVTDPVLENWVDDYFEKVGSLTVLESIEGPILPIEGILYRLGNNERTPIGSLKRDGLILDFDEAFFAKVTLEGEVLDSKENPIERGVVEQRTDGIVLGYIEGGYLKDENHNLINWLKPPDTCDLKKIRLRHLDGNQLTTLEYDHIQRFIRLWRKLGWKIEELDKAIVSVSGQHNGEITRDVLHQLVAIKKLHEKTGLPIIRLLPLWSEISTRGENALYQELFLKPHLPGDNSYFQADKTGNYLATETTLLEHVPTLMGALKMKADDISKIQELKITDTSDKLNLETVSNLYRYNLLAKILSIKVDELDGIIQLFGDPLHSPQATLSFLEKWDQLEDFGFELRELNYAIKGTDDLKKPFYPKKKEFLHFANSLFEGLNAIDEAHPDLEDQEVATIDLIRQKTGLLFEQNVVEEIVDLLEATYTTHAPKDLSLDYDEKKLLYDKLNGTIQLTGFLTEEEEKQYKGLSSEDEWKEAIDRVIEQIEQAAGKSTALLQDVLYAVFPNTKEAKEGLWKGDINKQEYFLKKYLPFLRDRLMQRFLVDSLSGAFNLPAETTEVLVSNVLKTEDEIPIIEAFRAIKNQTPNSSSEWNGYLIPAVTEDYTFVIVSDNSQASLKISGAEISFDQQEDPSNEWLSKPIKLKRGEAYTFEVTGLNASLKELSWKTPSSPRESIPATVLYPDHVTQKVEAAYIKLQKAAIIVKKFGLEAFEIEYFKDHASDFDELDFNVFTLEKCLRLHDYTKLRNSLPDTDTHLIEFFQWSHQAPDTNDLALQIANLTLWEKAKIELLIAEDHYDLLNLEDFHHEKGLIKLQKAITLANKIGLDIDSLFDWAQPNSNFDQTQQIAENIQKALSSRYSEEDWKQVAKPLNDRLRDNQKQALIDYLLVQPILIEYGIRDADSLFEFFLIDVQMNPCMETSRIKQAISSVQLFIQRCFLGLEKEKSEISNYRLDRERWEWMRRYRVWEANRKVFLYPENWIEPNLRDEKSPFFKELESELLQKDINRQTVGDALKNYLYKVDEVANMQVVGLHVEGSKIDEKWEEGSKLHVFSRTRNAPYFFFYRYLALDQMNWYPWEKMQVDVPSYDLEDKEGKITDNGVYLIPFVWNNRLLIFFPEFMKKTKPVNSGDIPIQKMADFPANE